VTFALARLGFHVRGRSVPQATVVRWEASELRLTPDCLHSEVR
jgi:hypothetical protein